jgi:hypothetical protein
MNRQDDIIKDLKEYWFKDHKATLTKQGDLEVLVWRNPNSGSYATRYVFDGSKMYISGDIGEAVFCLTWKANVHSFNDIYISYFMEKISAYNEDRYDFDCNVASERLEQWKQDLLEDREFENEFDEEEFIETIDNMIDDVANCNGEEQWAWEYVNEKYSDFISENDPDYWEWMYKIGRVIPQRIYAYLVGLQMASEQLKESK